VEVLVLEVFLLVRALPARYGSAGEAGATQVPNAEVALCGGRGGDTSVDDQTPCYQHLNVIPQRYIPADCFRPEE
jgi:hypothetical protein